jgi:hypothetical protein
MTEPTEVTVEDISHAICSAIMGECLLSAASIDPLEAETDCAQLFQGALSGAVGFFVQYLHALGKVDIEKLESDFKDLCNQDIESLTIADDMAIKRFRWLRDSAGPQWFEHLRGAILRNKFLTESNIVIVR